jgi:hypothetical protein
MPDNIYISASLLKDYLDCPRKVHYRLNFPELTIQTPEMVVGNIVHTTLEKFWDGRVVAVEYVKAQSMLNHLTLMHTDKALLCVSNFFDFFQGLVTAEDKIEYRFKIPFGDAFLVGKIDRVGAFGYVIDWKTSSNHTSNVNRDPQFILYQYVYEQIFEKAPSSVMRANLIDGSIDTYSRDKIMEYSIINSVIPSAIESIRKGTLSPTGLFVGKCARCPAKIACWKDLGY